MPYMGENSTSAEDSKGKASLPQKSTTDSSKMDWTDEATAALSQSNSNFAMQSCSDFMELDGVLPVNSSQPPSPDESRAPSPRLTNDPCPIRLLPLVPAPNFGTVAPHQIYRSSFPQAQNMEFISESGIRSILTLVKKTDSCATYNHYVKTCGINRKILNLEPNKEGQVKTNFDALCEAILFAINPLNHPVWIHCNQGRHRTGCVVACIRKIQLWPIDEILDEYYTYANPKPRDGDIQLIKDFDPEYVLDFAKKEGMLADFSSLLKNFGRSRNDSFMSVYELASSIPSHENASIYSSSNSSISDDGPLIMADPIKKAQADAEMNLDPMLRSSTPDVTVEEVEEEDDVLDDSMETQDGNNDDSGLNSMSGTSPPKAPPPPPPRLVDTYAAARGDRIERVAANRRNLCSDDPAAAFFLRSNSKY